MSRKKFAVSQAIGLVSICLLLGASACGVRELASGRLEPPEIALEEMIIYPPESQCWPLSARLRLTNPNPEPLRVLGYDFTFALEGAELIQGQSSTAVTVPAQAQAVVEIPLFLRLAAIPQALGALFKEEQVSYQLTGGVRLASVLGGLRLPFRFRGTLSRAQGWDYLRQYLGPQSLPR